MSSKNLNRGPVARENALAIRVPRRFSLKARFRHLFTRRLRPAANRFLVRFSRVGDPRFFDPALFPWTRKFEEHHAEIRAEAIGLSHLGDAIPTFHEVSRYQKRISIGSSWKTLWIRGFGRRSTIAEQLCPVTAKLLDDVPGLESACFSMLAPNSYIPRHRGVYKGLINYHLGVIVPKQAAKCWIEVGRKIVHWEEGKSCIFDDTNRHQVWNDSGEERVVLLLQFRRPLRQPGRFISAVILRLLQMTPYVREPAARLEILDRELRQVAERRGLLGDRHQSSAANS